jgi:hypothetical protein
VLQEHFVKQIKAQPTANGGLGIFRTPATTARMPVSRIRNRMVRIETDSNWFTRWH